MKLSLPRYLFELALFGLVFGVVLHLNQASDRWKTAAAAAAGVLYFLVRGLK
jgi:hypothetical protein